MNSTTLYIKDAKGAVRYWTISPLDNGVEMMYGVVGGSPQFKFEDVDEGKGGRDLEEQIESRMQSRINKRLDAGYVMDYETACENKATNRLGFSKPMLAKKECDVDLEEVVSDVFYVQHKLDGNRCLIHNDGEETIAYTRNGKRFTTLDHILDGLDIPIGATLDGELYIHQVPLQTIVSYVKRKQPDTEKVEYHVYDMISDEPFSRRNKLLLSVLKDNPNERIKIVKTTRYERFNPVEIKALFNEARKNNFEGLMIRSDFIYDRKGKSVAGYQDGKRSKSLIKIKGWESEEFTVVDIEASADGWAICICECKGGLFKASAPGSMLFKKQVFENRHSFIGLPLTVEFAYWTKDDKPFHPIAVAFRDYD